MFVAIEKWVDLPHSIFKLDIANMLFMPMDLW